MVDDQYFDEAESAAAAFMSEAHVRSRLNDPDTSRAELTSIAHYVRAHPGWFVMLSWHPRVSDALLAVALPVESVESMEPSLQETLVLSGRILPPAVERRFMNGSVPLRDLFAVRGRLSAAAFEALSGNPDTVNLVADNPFLSAEQQHHLAHHSPVEARRRLASNCCLDLDTLAVLASDHDAEVAAIAVAHDLFERV